MGYTTYHETLDANQVEQEAMPVEPQPIPCPDEIGERGRKHLVNMIERMDSTLRNLTEKECFLLEAATQHGFEFIDDNTDILAVTTESFVDFFKLIRQDRNEKALEPFKVNEFIDDEVATLTARFADILTQKNQDYLGELAGEFAREVAFRVIMDKVTLIDNLAKHCHAASASAGWWTDIHTGGDLRGKRNKGELLMLMVSEAAEIMEAVRKNLPSDKLPGFSGEEEEAADLFIRLGDYSGAHKLRLGEAVLAKMQYNASREDHKIENRRKADGKKF